MENIDHRNIKNDLKNLLLCIKCHEESSNTKVIQGAFETIICTCTNASNAKDFFREIGGLEYLLKFMCVTDSVLLLESALKTLSYIVDENVHNQKVLTCYQVFEAVKAIFVKSDMTPRILKNALIFLSTILFQNIKGQVLAAETDCLHELICLYKRYFPAHMLNNNTSNRDNSEDAILSFEVWQAVNRALCFAVNNPLNAKNQLTCSSLFSMALKILDCCMYHEVICAASLFLSLSVASNGKTQDMLSELGGLLILKNCLQKSVDMVLCEEREYKELINKNNLKITYSIIGIIDTACLDNDKNSALFGKLGVLSLLLKLLNVKLIDVQWKTRIILTFGHCIDICPENKTYLLQDDNISDLLKSCMLVGDEDLMSACKYLLHVCLRSDNMNTNAKYSNEKTGLKTAKRNNSIMSHNKSLKNSFVNGETLIPNPPRFQTKINGYSFDFRNYLKRETSTKTCKRKSFSELNKSNSIALHKETRKNQSSDLHKNNTCARHSCFSASYIHDTSQCAHSCCTIPHSACHPHVNSTLVCNSNIKSCCAKCPHLNLLCPHCSRCKCTNTCNSPGFNDELSLRSAEHLNHIQRGTLSQIDNFKEGKMSCRQPSINNSETKNITDFIPSCLKSDYLRMENLVQTTNDMVNKFNSSPTADLHNFATDVGNEGDDAVSLFSLTDTFPNSTHISQADNSVIENIDHTNQQNISFLQANEIPNKNEHRGKMLSDPHVFLKPQSFQELDIRQQSKTHKPNSVQLRTSQTNSAVIQSRLLESQHSDHVTKQIMSRLNSQCMSSVEKTRRWLNNTDMSDDVCSEFDLNMLNSAKSPLNSRSVRNNFDRDSDTERSIDVVSFTVASEDPRNQDCSGPLVSHVKRLKTGTDRKHSDSCYMPVIVFPGSKCSSHKLSKGLEMLKMSLI